MIHVLILHYINFALCDVALSNVALIGVLFTVPIFNAALC